MIRRLPRVPPLVWSGTDGCAVYELTQAHVDPRPPCAPEGL